MVILVWLVTNNNIRTTSSGIAGDQSIISIPFPSTDIPGATSADAPAGDDDGDGGEAENEWKEGGGGGGDLSTGNDTESIGISGLGNRRLHYRHHHRCRHCGLS